MSAGAGSYEFIRSRCTRRLRLPSCLTLPFPNECLPLEVTGDVHAVVQHPHDVHSFRGRLAKNNMGLVRVAFQSRRKLIAIAPNPEGVCECLGTNFQTVTILARLFDAKLVNTKIGDIRKVMIGKR